MAAAIVVPGMKPRFLPAGHEITTCRIRRAENPATGSAADIFGERTGISVRHDRCCCGSQGGAMKWMIESLQRVICGLHGHEAILQFEPNRLSLRCLNCNYETTGWILPSKRGVRDSSREMLLSGRDRRSRSMHKIWMGFAGLTRRHASHATM
jgi:hypothetical protein